MGSRSRCSSAVEQLFRKQQVVGSNPTTGSPKKRITMLETGDDGWHMAVSSCRLPGVRLVSSAAMSPKIAKVSLVLQAMVSVRKWHVCQGRIVRLSSGTLSRASAGCITRAIIGA